ncbi:hypothetical protein [Allosphingosinicella sp.]|uniref:hypothetical protein n=1 Tax=Allosphingosinicella sp. TaxID=2823234 RepID=UPI002FC2004B
MADELAMQAIDRIERALARIEATSKRAAATLQADGELIELRHAHHTLRAQVEGAIERIDRMLVAGEGA